MTAAVESAPGAVKAARVDAGGLDVYYREQGEGPPLVLIHGGLATGEVMWSREVVAELAREYRVLVPDSRGHGQTPNPAGTLSYGQMADDVAAFAAALGVERPLVLGYSDGAQVALELGLRHPALARAMVIGGVVTRPSEAYLQAVRGLGFPAPGEVDLAAVERALGGFFATVKAVHREAKGPDGLRRYLTQMSELWHGVPDYTDEQLSSITAPTLVISGDRDFPSLDDSLRLYRLLPRGELAVVPSASHGEDLGSRVFWEAVKEFLSRQVQGKSEETR